MTQTELMILIKEHLEEISESYGGLTLNEALDYFIEEIESFFKQIHLKGG